MEFHFNAELAKQYGVDGAIFLHCMAFWVAKNRANGRHYHEGRYWTYNTLEALSKLFPFWSRRQLERIINGLKEAGALLAGNFSEDRTDRTRWYALADCILEVYGESEPPISRNGEMHFTDRGQPFHETVKCNKETVTYQIDPPKPPKGGRRGSAELDGAVKSLIRYVQYVEGEPLRAHHTAARTYIYELRLERVNKRYDAAVKKLSSLTQGDKTLQGLVEWTKAHETVSRCIAELERLEKLLYG